MRGRINLEHHKLAGLYRAPARRARRLRHEKCPDEIYRQLWRLVNGAVRDTFANHPEYLTRAGQQACARSITKRVVGSIHGYATQVARGRSVLGVDASLDAAAVLTEARDHGFRHKLTRILNGAVGVVRVFMGLAPWAALTKASPANSTEEKKDEENA